MPPTVFVFVTDSPALADGIMDLVTGKQANVLANVLAQEQAIEKQAEAISTGPPIPK